MRPVIVPRRVGKMETVATQEEFRSRAGRRGISACGGEHEGCSIWRDVSSMDQLTHYYHCSFLYFIFYSFARNYKRKKEKKKKGEWIVQDTHTSSLAIECIASSSHDSRFTAML